jgi:hypothetical protein
MKKYAAGGKCGTMSSSFCDTADAARLEGASKDGVKEVNAKLSAALAERAKQDALFSSPAPASASASALASASLEQNPQNQAQQQQQAIVVLPTPAAANQKYSDIDLILSGDFEED